MTKHRIVGCPESGADRRMMRTTTSGILVVYLAFNVRDAMGSARPSFSNPATDNSPALYLFAVFGSLVSFLRVDEEEKEAGDLRRAQLSLRQWTPVYIRLPHLIRGELIAARRPTLILLLTRRRSEFFSSLFPSRFIGVLLYFQHINIKSSMNLLPESMLNVILCLTWLAIYKTSSSPSGKGA